MSFLKNEPENLLILKRNALKTNRNEPKNEAGKLLKTLECIKTNRKEPENEPADLIEKKSLRKIRFRQKPEVFTPLTNTFYIPSNGLLIF
jgi:hypothetical protein